MRKQPPPSVLQRSRRKRSSSFESTCNSNRVATEVSYIPNCHLSSKSLSLRLITFLILVSYLNFAGSYSGTQQGSSNRIEIQINSNGKKSTKKVTNGKHPKKGAKAAKGPKGRGISDGTDVTNRGSLDALKSKPNIYVGSFQSNKLATHVR